MDVTRKPKAQAAKAPAKQKPIEKMDEMETALAFCKECLGWQDAEEHRNQICAHKIPSGWNRSLDPFSRAHVLDTVRRWTWNKPKGVNAAILAKVPDILDTYLDSNMTEHEHCCCLMAACVEANRSQK
jgi:hypothetical protein